MSSKGQKADDPATKKCVDCLTNSDCPQGQVCNQSTKKCETPATNTPPVTPPGATPTTPDDDFNIEGAGCNCTTAGNDPSQSSTPALLGFGLALTVLARRRKSAESGNAAEACA